MMQNTLKHIHASCHVTSNNNTLGCYSQQETFVLQSVSDKNICSVMITVGRQTLCLSHSEGCIVNKHSLGNGDNKETVLL
jgi:hypothetical protein